MPDSTGTMPPTDEPPKPKKKRPLRLHKPTRAANLIAAERRSKAWSLKIMKYSNVQIAKALGIDESRVRQYLREVVERLDKEDLEKARIWRRLEVAHMDSLSNKIIERDLEVAKRQRDGQVAKRTNLRAVDRLVRISARRSKLLGLDMPRKIAKTDSKGRDLTRGWEQESDDTIGETLQRALENLKRKPSAG